MYLDEIGRERHDLACESETGCFVAATKDWSSVGTAVIASVNGEAVDCSSRDRSPFRIWNPRRCSIDKGPRAWAQNSGWPWVPAGEDAVHGRGRRRESHQASHHWQEKTKKEIIRPLPSDPPQWHGLQLTQARPLVPSIPESRTNEQLSSTNTTARRNVPFPEE